MTPSRHDVGKTTLERVVHRFIEDAGALTQSMGFGRAVGQIYAYLYFSETTRTLADMQHNLGISKGSASTNVRQLEQWGAVRKVWVKGDRKDYYEASDWFGKIVKNALMDTINKKIAAYGVSLDEAINELSSGSDNVDVAFVQTRLKHVRDFHNKAENLVTSPLWKVFLGGEGG